MEKLPLLFVVVYICICVCRAQSTAEEFKVTASTTSGTGNDLTWITTDANTIAAIKKKFMPNAQHDHQQHASNTVPELPSLLGYRGMVIKHIVNGQAEHTWIVPKCTSAEFETDLIQDCKSNHPTVCVPKDELIVYIDKTLLNCPSPAVVKRDVWKITVKYLTNRELTWDITEKDGNTAVQLIKYMKKELDTHDHSGTHAHALQNAPPIQWPTKTNYRGMNVAHYQNDKYLHAKLLAPCLIPNFQKYALLLYKTPNANKDDVKKINLFLQNCPKKVPL